MDAQSTIQTGLTDFRATGEILRMMRRARGISQSDLVAMLYNQFDTKCCVSQVSRYERGKQRLPAETAFICCQIYGYHPVTLTLCMIQNDRRWWKIMLSLDPGRFVETILISTFRVYKDRMAKLERADFRLASSMVLTLFDARLAPRRRPKSHPLRLAQKKSRLEMRRDR